MVPGFAVQAIFKLKSGALPSSTRGSFVSPFLETAVRPCVVFLRHGRTIDGICYSDCDVGTVNDIDALPECEVTSLGAAL